MRPTALNWGQYIIKLLPVPHPAPSGEFNYILSPIKGESR